MIYIHIILCYAYTQNFIIIKKKKIVDPMIDFDDYKILSNYSTNHMLISECRIF